MSEGPECLSEKGSNRLYDGRVNRDLQLLSLRETSMTEENDDTIPLVEERYP